MNLIRQDQKLIEAMGKLERERNKFFLVILFLSIIANIGFFLVCRDEVLGDIRFLSWLLAY